MNAEDDPERRIRELEQPLSDAARASELGSEFGKAQPAGGYNYQSPWAGAPVPPPPPPGSYGGGPFMAPRPPSGNRAWWILGALFVVGILALVGGIAAYAAHQFSRAGSVVLSTPPSISVSGIGVTSTSPSPTPTPVQHSVSMSWGPSSSPVVGYRVYRDGGAGLSPLSAITPALTYKDSTVVSGNTYHYAVTSIDSAGGESPYSNEVTTVIPIP